MMLLTKLFGDKNEKEAKVEHSEVLLPSDRVLINQVKEEHWVKEGENFRYDLHIPVILGIENPDLEKQIEADVNRDVTSHLNELLHLSQSMMPDIQYYLESTHRIYTHDDDILSFCIVFTNYLGNQEMSYKMCYNYDINLGKRLTLNDVFNDVDDKIAVNNEIEEQIIKKNRQYGYDVISGFRSITDYQKFYIKDGQLVIYFNIYDIAPYEMGILEFTIPKEIYYVN